MKLLLHMCCGPCAVWPTAALRAENVDFTGFFYNPNIHPAEEHARRLENLKMLAESRSLEVVYLDDFMQAVWENFDGAKEARCHMCYLLRMDKTAEFAAQHGYDAFSTTLLVSPYQKHEMIAEIGQKAASRHGVTFYYRDFRPNFWKGQQQAKEMGLYRQKYCGCIRSIY